MAKYRIIFDEATCIGAGECVEANPANWSLDQSRGKAVVAKTEIDETELEANLNAARMCPVQAIKIINAETGEEVK